MKRLTLIVVLLPAIAAITPTCLLAGGAPLDPSSVIFQAFYWDVPLGGTWYDTTRSKAPELRAAGFTHFWFPPPTKGAGGGYSMGYDLYDNYDLGSYDQKGTVETRFGSLSELQAAAAACENVLLDLVANHMAGAEGQCQDPADGQWYWQSFQYVHNHFWKGCMDFHPGYPDDCDLCNGNDYVMAEDVCHNSSYMFDGQKTWASWMKSTVGNVSGFRLDAAKHFSWDMSKAFGTIGCCIGEYWDSKDNILYWIDYTDNYAFDFPLYYAMQGDAAALDAAGLCSDKGVSFVANHDTDDITQKSRAYGFILYITPIPCVFWKDWFSPTLQPDIRRALNARRSHDFRGTRIIYKTDDFIIFKNNGQVFGCFNSAGSQLSGTIKATPNRTYTAIAWGPGPRRPADVTSDEHGNVTFTVPAAGYCYWYGGDFATAYDAVYVPGDNSQIFGCWWYFDQANKMALVADHTWRWVRNITEPTSVEYKFAMNGSWAMNRGLGDTSGSIVPQRNSNLAQDGTNIAANLPEGICVWQYHEDTETSRLFSVDFNGDGDVDLADLGFLAGHWMNRNCAGSGWCNATDLDMNGLVDSYDLALLVEFWLLDMEPPSP